MRVLAAMASIKDQDQAELGGRWSILHRQRRDHIRLDALLDRLEAASGDEQRAVLREVNRLVFPHAFAEESVLWPEIRKLPGGESLTRQVEQEHQEVNELVTQLDGEELVGEGRARAVRRLMTVLREDVRDEEDVLLPRLQDALDVRRLRVLGLLWEAVRRTAPTRPHPLVSRRPPGNALAGLPLTALDRGRDTLDAAALRMSPRPAALLRSASDRLGDAARAVERLPLLQSGEHPSTRVT
jgi:hemerythrin superfamily protein